MLLLVKCASIKPFFYALSFSSAPRNRNGAMADSGSWVGESGLGGPSNDVLLSAVIKKYCIVIILFLCALAVICIRMVAALLWLLWLRVRILGSGWCRFGFGSLAGQAQKAFRSLISHCKFLCQRLCVCVCECTGVCGRFSAAPAPAASRSNHTHCN